MTEPQEPSAQAHDDVNDATYRLYTNPGGRAAAQVAQVESVQYLTTDSGLPAVGVTLRAFPCGHKLTYAFADPRDVAILSAFSSTFGAVAFGLPFGEAFVAAVRQAEGMEKRLCEGVAKTTGNQDQADEHEPVEQRPETDQHAPIYDELATRRAAVG